MFKLKASFIGDFILGDNINTNLQILKLLYKYYKKADSEEQRYLRKPITIILISIIEAILYDFLTRIKAFSREGVSSLKEEVVKEIRSKNYRDELKIYIDLAKKHDFFLLKDTNFYEVLDNLRRLRNRIHIQNIKKDFEPKEYGVFTEKRKEKAEKVLEKIIKTMCERHYRGKYVSGHVKDFELPWEEYFPPIKKDVIL